KTITITELTEINKLFCEFVTHYEREYIKNNSSQIPAALISYHYLLHISTSIRNTGPAWATWQYCMNRTEMQRLRAYYITALNIHTNQLALITDSVQKYGKLQINGKLAINSKLSNR
ncbi:18229_t:CDS:2, partial [Funneliformis geosporum]